MTLCLADRRPAIMHTCSTGNALRMRALSAYRSVARPVRPTVRLSVRPLVSKKHPPVTWPVRLLFCLPVRPHQDVSAGCLKAPMALVCQTGRQLMPYGLGLWASVDA